MKLVLEERLPVPPERAWGLVTEPEVMNLWSEARIELLSAGDGGTAGGVGTLRRVTVRALGGASSFVEVIEHAEAPHRLVYRVIAGLPVRHHRGEITLTADGDGTRLRWQVEFEFPLPGMGSAARALLVRQLGASVRAMSEVAARAPIVALPPVRDVLDLDRAVALRAAAENVRDEQRALAQRLAAANDPRQWFARVYRHVTECQLEHCVAGRATYATWVHRTIVRFHHYYLENLRRSLGELPGEPEAHWVKAFHAALYGADASPRTPARLFAYGLYRGMRAHIEHDLPRALADVWRTEYRGRCDYVRFRADYLLMGDVFRDASVRLLGEVPSAWVPAWMRVMRATLPREALDRALAKRFYDISRHRHEAFTRGGELAAR